uniref:Molybdate-anion transporter n=1 Tax=Chaetoceros debilis TaxID=122233 RepID=A0A7S3PZA1_9STRA
MFSTIFFIALLFNAAATLRSSSYWSKFKSYFVSPDDGARESLLTTGDSESSPSHLKEKHSALLKKYLAVYLLAVLSDWMQGPYVYALYLEYGYSQHEIAQLFVAGFGSSMIFGTFIGGLADTFGRRKFVVVFSIIYALSCVTKHFRDYWILMIGRLLGGIATSLLFSVFDSWLIKSHNEAGVSSFLSKSFAVAQYGNSIVAISSGLVANKAADLTKLHPIGTEGTLLSKVYVGGYLVPFDLSFCALVVCGILVSILWGENYGNETQSADKEEDANKKSWYSDFVEAYFTTIRSKDILYTGLVSSLFEGSMYIFVFMWTPAMKALMPDEDIPFGTVFATFMVCCMAGSSIFSTFIGSMKNEKFGVFVFSAATVAFILMTLANTAITAIIAFLLFETTVGCYFPMMGTMKSAIVPENKRAAIYNIYRIPLNFIVLFSLLTDLTPKTSFTFCIFMLATAACLQLRLSKRTQVIYTSVATKVADDLELGDIAEDLSTKNSED